MGTSDNIDSFCLFNRHNLQRNCDIFKAEQAAAGTTKIDNSFNEDEGHILYKAKNIAGCGRSHVSFFACFFVLSCLLVMTTSLKNGWTYKFLCGVKGCDNKACIKEDKSLMPLEFNGRHEEDSHKGLVKSRKSEKSA